MNKLSIFSFLFASTSYLESSNFMSKASKISKPLIPSILNNKGEEINNINYDVEQIHQEQKQRTNESLHNSKLFSSVLPESPKPSTPQRFSAKNVLNMFCSSILRSPFVNIKEFKSGSILASISNTEPSGKCQFNYSTAKLPSMSSVLSKKSSSQQFEIMIDRDFVFSVCLVEPQVKVTNKNYTVKLSPPSVSVVERIKVTLLKSVSFASKLQSVMVSLLFSITI